MKLKEENKDESKIKILIIGGGDLLVAYYLINKYDGSKFEITIVDQDERVT
jgi:spermidine synthase